MNEKQEIISRIYGLARLKGLCKTQKEFADLVGVHQSTISLAIKGDERYLSEKLVRSVVLWARTEGLDEEVPAPEPPAPDIVIPAATATLYNNMSETIRLQAEIIARLQGGLSAPGAGVYPQKNFRTDGI